MKERGLLVVLMLATLMSGCTKNVKEPNEEFEHEGINSIIFTFKQNGITTGTFVAEDPDGDGGNAPTKLDTIKLMANQTYTMDITIRNLSGNVITDITGEINEEGKDHELYYLVSGINATVLKTDRDENNLPIGIKSTWTTTTAGSGNVLVKLMHKPAIKAAGDDENKGSTDLALNIPVKVQ